MKRFLFETHSSSKSTKNKKQLSESRFTNCPICFKNIALHTINDHLDSDCSSTKTSIAFAPHQKNIVSPTLPLNPLVGDVSNQKPSGLYIIESFLSIEEENDLINILDNCQLNPWVLGSFNGPSKGKKWGIRTNLKTREFQEPLHELPKELLNIAARIRTISQPSMKDFYPNEANAISYEKAKGHYLGAHCDDRQLSGKILVNLSLGGDATMVYTKDGKGGKKKSLGLDRYEVLLKRRSLQIQTGSVRYNYNHGIPHDNFISDRRVSITFRMNAHKSVT
mmetsp:Transcript_3181/g.3942  ORF Transcript_3181/g.3942 Transcript_3181/m.3942 type:complete len:279 (-) Transcript_3181:140-976(-)|eukprot:CAMPEP_0114347704 /NCGR_PEP_ID=MMETSP0101-20121206/14125_1 /TAXON_ID=38822 ORGANISM="Pteridomonas danica, Strain PT" /NCGR_SAMPLE_ID=MMETSP0101 /ASSEMBLY_ACC=CAM_ASM_000211 /LENGTH=278 /DNA_ID=CAMNT_0001485197 /DNA_START=53 /DNA_END=889 /DNA_ORIENTATION=-